MVQQDKSVKKKKPNINVIKDISITVNGDAYRVHDPDPKMTLNEWLRNSLHLKGTKFLCGEGGCGCCVVAVSKDDPISCPESIKAINSCLCPLLSLDGHYVFTVEGLGGQKDGFHPIQKRFASNFASQCGFCTPGFVMNGFSLLASGTSLKTKQEIEDNFDGNVCRCTGYRPIMDAMKSFSSGSDPVDIEDLRKPCCKSLCFSGRPKVISYANELRSDALWYKPSSLTDLSCILSQLKVERLKFVAGNTGTGIFKNEGDYDAFIDLKEVRDLSVIELKENSLTFGSTVTLTQMANFMEKNSIESDSFSVLAKHIKKVANVPVRNVATWAGNLMMTHVHKHFASDIYLILDAAGAELDIADVNGNFVKCSIGEFMQMQMDTKVIVSVTLPFTKENEYFQTEKIMPRKQTSFAYVNAGFRAVIDKTSLVFKERPTIIHGGWGLKMRRAKEVEEFLFRKSLKSPGVFTDAVNILEQTLAPNPDYEMMDFDYCKRVAINLFYKFCLLLRGERMDKRLLSGIQPFKRPVSSGQQSFHVSDEAAPLNQPRERIEGKLQASGEVLFVGDLPASPHEVFAAFVLSTKGNAVLEGIDCQTASKHPAFVRLITAEDIPGENNFLEGKSVEEILVSKDIAYAGQPVALVVAESQTAANEIAKSVNVKYRDIKRPVISLEEAIEREEFLPKEVPDNVVGDVEAAFMRCDHVITGEVKSGAQHHFYIEPQTCSVIREEHDYKVFSSSQSTKDVKYAVATALDINAASVDVQVTRLGGAFGGKYQYPPQLAAAAAVAVKVLDRPVRAALSLGDNLKSVGKRPSFLSKYKVGFTNEGYLKACEVHMYVDAGKSRKCDDGRRASYWLDGAYFCPNWMVSVTNCKTNTPFNTFFRGPGNLQCMFVIESIIDHIATFLGAENSEKIKEINLFKNGQKTLFNNLVINNCLLSEIWKEIKIKSCYEKRLAEVMRFNQNYRWRKRGISIMPLKYDLNYYVFNHSALVSIYYADGTVAVSHGGVEMGQGINTRVQSVAAAKLGIPVEFISVKPHSTITCANTWESGGSVASEICCLAVVKCCEILLDRIAPVKQRFPNADWKKLIQKCAAEKVDLSTTYMYFDAEKIDYCYSTYGAACTEAEIDVLTGEIHILRSDIMYDCGESINPRLDVGQIEGAFVQGMGYYLTEKVAYDQNGEQLSVNTLGYKVPMPKDAPIDMRVYLRRGTKNPIGIVRSKAVGEPGICMSASCLFAVKNAVKAARQELRQSMEHFTLDAPATIDKIQSLCNVGKNDLIM